MSESDPSASAAPRPARSQDALSQYALSQYTVLDYIGLAMLAVATLGLLAWIPLNSSFFAVYADFGAFQLPFITRLLTNTAAPIVMFAVFAVAAVLSVRRPKLNTSRRLVAGMFVVSLLAHAALYFAAYAPALQLAQNVQ